MSIFFPYMTWSRNWTNTKVVLFFAMSLIIFIASGPSNPYDVNGGIAPGNEGTACIAVWMYVHFVSILSHWFIDKEF